MRTIKTKKDSVGGLQLADYVDTVTKQLQCEEKYAAIHGYRSALHSFQRFAGGDEVSLPMCEVFMPDRIKAYEGWLLVSQKLELNTVSDYMRSLRAMYNRWRPLGSKFHNPKLFSEVYTKVVSKAKLALEQQQMQQLSRLSCELVSDDHPSPSPQPTSRLSAFQRRAFGYFMLMFFFRGMPFIDLAHLRKCDVQNNYLVYRRHKTGRLLMVEITPQARRLMQQLQDTDPANPYLFPILHKDARTYLQQHRCYTPALRSFNRTLRQVAAIVLPGVQLSSYTARHTWATIAYHKGNSIAIISQALGHSSVRITATYLKPFPNEQIDEVNRQIIADIYSGEYKCKRRKWRYEAYI